MSEVKNNLKYTSDHEWLDISKGDIVTIGITDYAQNALGDLVFVELPEIGMIVKKGEELAVVESVKTASEVYVPIDGEITEINESLTDTPEKINSEPYEGGWIAKIKVKKPSDLDELLNHESYNDLIS